MKLLAHIWLDPLFTSVESGFDPEILTTYSRGQCHLLAKYLFQEMAWPIIAIGTIVNLGVIVRQSIAPRLTYFKPVVPMQIDQDIFIIHFCNRHPSRGIIDIFGHHHISLIQAHFSLAETERIVALECQPEALDNFIASHPDTWDQFSEGDQQQAENIGQELLNRLLKQPSELNQARFSERAS